jgi:hypothetical protein
LEESLRDQENPNEKKVSGYRAEPPRLMSDQDHFLHYLNSSLQVRRAHGVDKEGVKWVVHDLEKINRLPEWQKEILRGLVRNPGVQGS